MISISEAFRQQSPRTRSLAALVIKFLALLIRSLQNQETSFPEDASVALLRTHLAMTVAIFDIRQRPLGEVIQGREIRRQGDLASELPLRTTGRS